MRQTSETTEEAEKLRVFQISVVTLAADLTSTVPLRPGQSVKEEMKARRDLLREWFNRWLACPWVGYPTEERMDELLYVLLERDWLTRFSTVDAAVGHLRQSIRTRSKRIDALPFVDQLVAATTDADLVEEIYLADQVAAIEGPCRRYLAEKLAGESCELLHRAVFLRDQVEDPPARLARVIVPAPLTDRTLLSGGNTGKPASQISGASELIGMINSRRIRPYRAPVRAPEPFANRCEGNNPYAPRPIYPEKTG